MKINLDKNVSPKNDWWPSSRWASCILVGWLVYGFLTTPSFVTGTFGVFANYAAIMGVRYIYFRIKEMVHPGKENDSEARTFRTYIQDGAVIALVISILLTYDAITTRRELAEKSSYTVGIISSVVDDINTVKSWKYQGLLFVESFFRGFVLDLQGADKISNRENALYAGLIEEHNNLHDQLKSLTITYHQTNYQLVWSISNIVFSGSLMILLRTKLKRQPMAC